VRRTWNKRTKFDTVMRSEVNNLVSHNLVIDVKKGVHTVRHKERGYPASALHYFSHRRSVINISMNKCIVNGRRDWTRNDGMRSHRCVLSTNQSSF